MATEIERKFLVNGRSWKNAATGVIYRQGYIRTQRHIAVRIRIAGDAAYLTLKGQTTPEAPLSRAEFEYAIPVHEAQIMLDTLCDPEQILKTRYKIPHKGHVWEVDEFHGANEGLVVAEIELTSENEAFERPEWVGQDVSTDPRYSNAALAQHPYSQWTK